MPNTIAQNLQRLVNAKNAISEAITAKGGTVSTGDGFEVFPADIATIPSGGGGESGDASKPVRFMDYDGSIVASYTPEEFAELTEMPANPTHDGLTAQGWNWTLSDAKDYVSNYGMLDVGQMYITDDGRTRLYVRIQDGRRSPVLKLYLNANSELDIDWGDDTSHSTFTSTSADYKSERHSYASAGDYIISIGVTSGSFSLQSSFSNSDASSLFTNDGALFSSPDIGYLNTICKVEIGDNVTSIGTKAFTACRSLSQITIPNSVTSIGNSTFYYCYSLSQITIPNSVTSIGNSAFTYCVSLSQITIPNSVTSIESSTFYYCYSLSQITIPNSVTSIGNSAFIYCYSLSQITIPNGVTSIGTYAFYYCYSLSQIMIPNGVTSIDTYAFSHCLSLSQITIPNGVTSIKSNAFSESTSLSQITIPNGVTSIESSAFSRCLSLSQITIPNGVTSIDTYAFYNCLSLGYIKFVSQTPPTVTNSNTWAYIPTDCKILVPRGRLSAYKSATNYPSSSTYTYEEYD